MNDLLLARVPAPRMHFVAREGLDLTDLCEANLLQTSDLIRSAQLGLVIGGLTGVAAGVVTALFLQGDTAAIPWGWVGALTLLGGLFGVWASSMIGIATPSHRLERFSDALAAGQILLMLDVPRTRVQEIEAMLQQIHPEARFEGVEPDMPAFP
jgi:hypothetical protein